MPKYDDDQCVQCGGIRVAKSTLCADCLAALCSQRLVKIDILVKEKKELEGKNKKLTELCERLLDHITNNSVYTGELEQAIYSTWLKNWKEGQDEKGRVHDNK